MTRDLDETSFPAWRDAIARFEEATPDPVHEPRAYPGYPRVELPRPHRRRFRSSLERALVTRESPARLATAPLTADELGRLLHFAHGAHRPGGRGPVPSAGALQALELYASPLAAHAWLAPGRYHYDRAAHALARLAPEPLPAADIPSLALATGGALAFILVGDRARASAKYGDRAGKFLLLEAGHLMQNLCLLSADLGLATVPLGGFFERALARALQLPATDDVLYVGLCGRVT